MITRKSSRVLTIAGLTAIAGVALSGCSQINSLQQVSGVPVTILTMASSYVLQEQKVAVLVEPDCEDDPAPATSMTCIGKTVAGEEIKVTSTGSKALTITATPANGTATALPAGTLQIPMKMTIGSKVVFEGDAQQVVNNAQGVGATQ